MSRKLKGLQKRLNQLEEDISAAEAQLGSRSGADRKRQKRELNNLYEECDEIEEEIRALKSTRENNNQNRSVLQLKQKLVSLNHKRPKRRYDKIFERFGNSGGSATLLIDESHNLKGDLLISYIHDFLSNRCDDFRVYPVELTPVDIKNEQTILSRLSDYFAPNEQYSIESIIKNICTSFQNGTILVFEFKNWDDLEDPCATLKWFINNFWMPFVQRQQSYCQQERIAKVRIFFLIVCQSRCNSISKLDKFYYASHSEFNPLNSSSEKSIIRLMLQKKWNADEIKEWMCFYPPPKYKQSPESILEHLAKRFFRISQGIPLSIVDLIEKEYRDFSNDRSEVG